MIVGKRTVAEVTGRKNLLYDRDGEQHYNLISAFHKSMRNSDPDAAVYWLARMLAGGEDPLFIARRMIEFAGDDVGLADPDAQLIAVSCFDACRFMGMPDCRYALAETAVYLSLAPRSNSLAVSIDTALEDARRDLAEPVPMHLRNAPTELMEKVGYSKGYEYAEGTEEKITRMQCLPDSKKGTKYYEPGQLGAEQQYRRRLNAIRDWKEGRREDPPFRSHQHRYRSARYDRKDENRGDAEHPAVPVGGEYAERHREPGYGRRAQYPDAKQQDPFRRIRPEHVGDRSRREDDDARDGEYLYGSCHGSVEVPHRNPPSLTSMRTNIARYRTDMYFFRSCVWVLSAILDPSIPPKYVPTATAAATSSMTCPVTR